jgi:hypothetical protein
MGNADDLVHNAVLSHRQCEMPDGRREHAPAGLMLLEISQLLPGDVNMITDVKLVTSVDQAPLPFAA